MLRNILFESQIPIDPQNMQDIFYAAKQTRYISPSSTDGASLDRGSVLQQNAQQQTKRGLLDFILNPSENRYITTGTGILQDNPNNRDLGTGMSWEQIQKNKEFLRRSGLDKPSGVPLDSRDFMN